MSRDFRSEHDAGVHSASRCTDAASVGDELFSQRRFPDALARFQEAVRDQPENADYRLKLGRCAWILREFDIAEQHFLEAHRLAPKDPAVHKLLAEFCFATGKMQQALVHSNIAYRLKPHDPQFIVAHAAILHEDSRTDQAWELVEPLLKSGVCSVPLALLYSRLAPKVQREEAALSCIGFLLRSLYISPHEAVQLHFAAAALLDRAGRYDEAFEHARCGKEASRPPYDPLAISQWIDSQIDYFTADKLSRLPRATHGGRRPVFIIGMPRSGTTLVEQILASHSEVYGTGELRTLMAIRRSAWKSDWAGDMTYPALLDRLTVGRADELANIYLSTISSHNSTATYVTDKMPDNFLLLGLIATLFPQSHVIHCTRDVLDTCLSCYMTYFAAGQDFSHDLVHLAAFYRDYERLMAHWTKVLKYPVIEINYENLVNDFEFQTRRLLDCLGLPWEEQCLRYYQSKRPVLTASCDQVRSPIYASSAGRWKRYEKQLSPLMSALGLPGY